MEVLQTSALPLGYAASVLERETGFEPATSTLARLHSTTELLPLNEKEPYALPFFLSIKNCGFFFRQIFGGLAYFSRRLSMMRLALPSERSRECGSMRRTLVLTPRNSLMVF